MKPPSYIKSVAVWEDNCRRIHARAVDFLEGRLDMLEAAAAIGNLVTRTGLNDDPDLKVFRSIEFVVRELPYGEERKLWAPSALAREDVKIRQVEMRYKAEALAAAAKLKQRFAWAVEARNQRRAGNGKPDDLRDEGM